MIITNPLLSRGENNEPVIYKTMHIMIITRAVRGKALRASLRQRPKHVERTGEPEARRLYIGRPCVPASICGILPFVDHLEKSSAVFALSPDA